MGRKDRWIKKELFKLTRSISMVKRGVSVCVKRMNKGTYFNNTVAQNDNLQYQEKNMITYILKLYACIKKPDIIIF